MKSDSGGWQKWGKLGDNQIHAKRGAERGVKGWNLKREGVRPARGVERDDSATGVWKRKEWGRASKDREET